jgi:ribosomal protein L40E
MSEAHEHVGRVCTKCGTENPPKTDLCTACGAHLYLVCRECKHRNYRGLSNCEKCNQPLRPSDSRNIRRLFNPTGGNVKFTELLVAAIVVVIFLYIALRLAEMFSGFTIEHSSNPRGARTGIAVVLHSLRADALMAYEIV